MNGQRPLALVTGGMRRLGAVIAAKLAQEGYDIAVSTHDPAHLNADIGGGGGGGTGDRHGFIADLSHPGAADILLNDIIAHFGRAPNLLVNNAAIFGQDDWSHMSAETLDAHFRLNFFAPLLLSRALVAAAGPQEQPAIVHILDQRIVNPHGDQISYTLSKQALAASVRSLASAFGGRARVNGVAPGLVIATDDYHADQGQRLGAMMPLGALPGPAGVADAVHYLGGARHVTGQIIYVDGGAHLKSFDRDFVHL